MINYAARQASDATCGFTIDQMEQEKFFVVRYLIVTKFASSDVLFVSSTMWISFNPA
jgi:hypothetical protein